MKSLLQLKKIWNYDRRYKFYDLSKVNPQSRTATSPILQFYSSVDNIGNFTPVLGMRKMLSQTPDTWCIHDRNIDFDFINSHYKGVVIGGAGLMHKCFDPFWQKMLHECKLPVVIWGVGVCLPQGSEGADRETVSEVAKRCDLIDVRDDITVDYYGLKNAHIGACPTIVYLQDFAKDVHRDASTVLFSSHEELVSDDETEEIKNALTQAVNKYIYTDNIQKNSLGLEDIISKYYCRSKTVVTTRLHGAIISYGLDIPYIAISRDEKLDAFHRLYGNGLQVNHPSEIADALTHLNQTNVLKPMELDCVLSFGNQVKKWTDSLGK